TVTEDVPQPQCVICKEVLANDSMRPNKRHIETKHPTLATKPREFFDRKLSEEAIATLSAVNTRATKASYHVALRIAKAGKPHNIGETLLLPAAKDINAIPMSDKTIQRRISDTASDVKEQVLDNVRKSPFFSIQLEESTDVASCTTCAQLMVYVRYIKELGVQEEFLFCHPLPARTTAGEIFKALNDFVQESHIDWGHCCGICTDGARAMTGRHSGVVKWVQAVWKHCIIHRQALAAEKMKLRNVLDEAVKIVKQIKSPAMNARLFSILCTEMGAHFQQLLLHSAVRWLSRVKILTRGPQYFESPCSKLFACLEPSLVSGKELGQRKTVRNQPITRVRAKMGVELDRKTARRGEWKAGGEEKALLLTREDMAKKKAVLRAAQVEKRGHRLVKEFERSKWFWRG
ncbi:SCAN domain-containing protein 3-like, partial [Odontesthes bonariensis]|uniref:SCAN domain-containing protein 3-like n=1 Tax=Odontesthes bonariensis TaxID=219752 RepID=UPI003F58F389